MPHLFRSCLILYLLLSDLSYVSKKMEMLIYFLQDFYDEIADQIFKLREQREKCTVNTAAGDAQIARINELQDFHQTAPCSLRGLRRGPGETMA